MNTHSPTTSLPLSLVLVCSGILCPASLRPRALLSRSATADDLIRFSMFIMSLCAHGLCLFCSIYSFSFPSFILVFSSPFLFLVIAYYCISRELNRICRKRNLAFPCGTFSRRYDGKILARECGMYEHI